MSLFVGNLSKFVKFDEIESEFTSIGPCKVQLKVSTPLHALRCLEHRLSVHFAICHHHRWFHGLLVSNNWCWPPIALQNKYAFVEYDDDKDAEEAKTKL